MATGSNAIKPDKFLKTFESSLKDVFSELSEKLLLDGEGATKLIEIKVSGLRSKAACKEVAKNSKFALAQNSGLRRRSQLG